MPLDGGNEFMTASRTWTFPRGVGLPGNVWATGEAIWLPDLPQRAASRVSNWLPERASTQSSRFLFDWAAKSSA